MLDILQIMTANESRVFSLRIEFGSSTRRATSAGRPKTFFAAGSGGALSVQSSQAVQSSPVASLDGLSSPVASLDGPTWTAPTLASATVAAVLCVLGGFGGNAPQVRTRAIER